MKARLVLTACLLFAAAHLAKAQDGETGVWLYSYIPPTPLLVLDSDTDNLVSNGGFELTQLSTPFQIDLPGATTITGWTIDGAGVVHTGSYWQAAEGVQSVELNFAASGGISQLLNAIPGQEYQLEFDLSGEPGMGDDIKELQVFWNDSLFITMDFDTTGHTIDDMGWQHVILRLPAVTGQRTELRFFGSSPSVGNGGAAIDNVSVVAVPETSSLLLAASALIPAGLIARWTRKRAV